MKFNFSVFNPHSNPHGAKAVICLINTTLVTLLWLCIISVLTSGVKKMTLKMNPEKKAKRVNISIRDEIKEKAKRLGYGNVSRGIEIAIRQAAEVEK